MGSTIGKFPAAIPPGFGAILYIDLDAIATNYATLCRCAQGAAVAASVKADAYGLGLLEVAPVLARAGCRTFFVATADEGRELRNILPDAEICVLNGYDRGERDFFFHDRLTPVLNSLEQIHAWRQDAGAEPPCMLHVDTGMNRLGLGPEDVSTLVGAPSKIAELNITCILSHLACADDAANPVNSAQLAAFENGFSKLAPLAPLTAGAPLAGGAPRASLANSAGIFLGAEYHFDMVRAGAALYGLAPQGIGPDCLPNPMRQVVHLFAKILQIRDIDTPMTVGYGATHKVRGRCQIATVSVGYGDGYLRISSQTDEDNPNAPQWGLHRTGSAFLGGNPAPLVGRISMDLMTLDITDIPAEFCTVGAAVELIGENLSVDDVADAGGTIGYEVLTRLGTRYHRTYYPAQDQAPEG